MPQRRKYKVPGFRDGGRVPVSADPPAEIDRQAEIASPDERPLSLSADDALLHAVEGQRRAEEMQAQRPATIESFIDSMPGLSDHKRAFLKRNSDMLQPDRAELMRQAHGEALQAGIADDSGAMDAYLESAVRTELEARRARLAGAARAAAADMIRPPPPEMSIERAAEQLSNEADALSNAYHAEASTPLSMADQIGTMAPPPSQRRSMPMTAPVTRDVPMPSGQRMGSASQITLSAEERFIARNSFSDPHLSHAERERLYAQNKSKLARERAEGRYPMPERG